MKTSFKARMLGAAFGAGMILAGGAALAQDDADTGIPGTFTGNIAITTDYIFRGITQTDKGPAVQGGFDYSNGMFYAGTWASSVEFLAASTEVDFYAGIKPDLGGVTLDIGAVFYAYPDSIDLPAPYGDLDYWEAYLGASGTVGEFLSLAGKIYYSPDFFGGTDAAWYYGGNASIPLGSLFTLSGHVGYQDFDDPVFAGYTDDYIDWTVGISTTFEGLGLALTYGDTDLDTPFPDTDQLWFTVSKAL